MDGHWLGCLLKEEHPLLHGAGNMEEALKVYADIRITYLPTCEHMPFIHTCVYTHARYVPHEQKFMKASFPHVNICLYMYT